MYGKHFSSMYSGSMVGAGAVVFAVMGYVISHYHLDKEVGAQVELNPKLLGPILGEAVEEVQKAIGFLCRPDPESRSKEEDGRRLIQVGQFDYRVVNGAKYTGIMNEEQRREYNRLAKQRQREREKGRKNRKKAPAASNGEASAEDRQEEVMKQSPPDHEVRKSIRERLERESGEKP